ncbi:GntR family transcriptional regulator [Pseudoflavonifractor sp. SW1122]|uniref:GntR family transcriptional regulator n=1 Tax=Pseudoflavonifractor sp. SW1122 TaxID=2530044 RepID=UPI00143C8C8B|nr:GntR family transcriptional regulator [Pseudoflavonifractor sp. SW1122]NJE73518.1 GntR family transcriptional regulator [Pseudoflavonifractor sp. SW1122]
MLLQLDFNSERPIYQQIRDQIVVGIAQGVLSPGEKLPTVRALADEAGVNMMTVSRAYQLLKQEGYITTDRRSGTVVSAREGAQTVSEQTMKRLKLALSELRVAGWSRAQVLELCQKLYEQEG